MDFLIGQIIYFREIAINTYNVNPDIFVMLYIGLTPTYYLGAGIAGHEALTLKKITKLNKIKFKFHDLLLRKKFLYGYAINRLSWFGPYFYVIVWGSNLPTRFYILIICWTTASGYITLHNIKTKKQGSKIKN